MEYHIFKKQNLGPQNLESRGTQANLTLQWKTMCTMQTQWSIYGWSAYFVSGSVLTVVVSCKHHLKNYHDEASVTNPQLIDKKT